MLTDEHHHLLALWAAECAEHVLPLFEAERPDDPHPREAIQMIRAWVRGEVKMTEAHDFAFVANASGRDLKGPGKFAALSAGQAVAVAHVAAHDLGAAAYAIRAARAAAPKAEELQAGRAESAWQRSRLPGEVRALVLDDQKRRNAICWDVFD